MEEIELRRLARLEGSGVEGEGMLSLSVLEKLLLRALGGGREPRGGGYWDSGAEVGGGS